MLFGLFWIASFSFFYLQLTTIAMLTKFQVRFGFFEVWILFDFNLQKDDG
jgi:hypothetical protein